MTTEFKLIVAGGRNFQDMETMEQLLYKFADENPDKDISIVSGMARGADKLAWEFAKKLGVKCYEFPANWDHHGKSAGYKRNEEMARFADGLLAFWDGQSRGTQHMIDIATRMGLPVHVEEY